MNDLAFETQVRELILQLLPKDGSGCTTDEWKTCMNPVRFGVLSWTIGAFYWSERV